MKKMKCLEESRLGDGSYSSRDAVPLRDSLEEAKRLAKRDGGTIVVRSGWRVFKVDRDTNVSQLLL
jgi:hypothetical protein